MKEFSTIALTLTVVWLIESICDYIKDKNKKKAQINNSYIKKIIDQKQEYMEGK